MLESSSLQIRRRLPMASEGDVTPQSTTKSASAGSSTPPIDTNSAQLIPTSASSAQHLDTDTETDHCRHAIIGHPVLIRPNHLVCSKPRLSQALPTTVAITSPVAVGNIINQSEVSPASLSAARRPLAMCL